MRFALIREGRADAELVSVLIRLCASLGARSIDGSDVGNLGVGRRVADQVAAVLAIDPGIELFFVHMDADNEGLDARRHHLATALERCGRPYSRVVPVRETEAWLLVDEQRIREVVGYAEGNAPLGLPKRSHVEDLGDPKLCLRNALSRAQRPRKHQRREVIPISNDDYVRCRRELLETLDIDGPITQLSAWQALVQDTQTALSTLETPSA
jgi:hypothetical protein